MSFLCRFFCVGFYVLLFVYMFIFHCMLVLLFRPTVYFVYDLFS